ncbi:LpqB family beta-propeller domain-containing protein [Agromyces sp. LHK192]|uniref:LpqB family beta-propeller domain-containing protein n=1 Tax=Agromyces sp. LHK192 TaxID=2498704 RepID=UPI000FDC8382|nr:LpqB family beta-propeller domain-containing protein [Agromyces sp. LHK192]
MRDPRRGGVLVALAALVAFTGCASIPDSGAVHRGEPQARADSPDPELIAEGPEGGETQDQILRGFLDAATDARDNYAVAREFLTPAFGEEWRADDGATIDQFASREFETTGEAAMRLEVVPTAELSANGQYQITGSPAPIALDYAFEQVDEEWRISSAPPGILIDTSNFTRAFNSHALTFIDPTEQYAVPDIRWFAGREAVQTKIVRALLAGPAEWLDPGVATAFPEDAALAADAVPITSGVASVELTGVSTEDQRTVQLMRFQLDQSLDGVRGVGDVELSLNGVVQRGEGTRPLPVVDPVVPARPVVYDGESFGHLSAGGASITPIEGISEQLPALAPTGAAVGADGQSAAVRAADGVSLVTTDEEPISLDPRADLIVPAIDGFGVVWTVPRGSPDQLTASRPDGSSVQVPVPWTGTEIAALEVSRDGTRVLALLGDGATTRFVAASIVRDADGMPVELGKTVLDLEHIDGSPRDVVWLDDRSVASLTASGSGTRVIVQVLGGVPEAVRAGPDGGVELSGGNTVGDLRVRTETGDFDVRSGQGWQAQATGIVLVATQLPLR